MALPRDNRGDMDSSGPQPLSAAPPAGAAFARAATSDRGGKQAPAATSFFDVSAISGLIHLISLLYIAFTKPDDLDAEQSSSLASMLGFGDTDTMNKWRSAAAGDFMSAFASAPLGRADRLRIEVDYEKYAHLADSGNPLLELIGQHESGGDYSVAYSSTVKGGIHPSINGKSLEECTINEVLAWQKSYTDAGSPSSAAGKYQMIRKTLAGCVEEMGLTGNEVFDAKMQDRIAMHLLERRGLEKYLNGSITEEKFMSRIAREWASMPKDRSGRGAYDGDGLNMAGAKPGELSAAMRQVAAIVAAAPEIDVAAATAPSAPAVRPAAPGAHAPA